MRNILRLYSRGQLTKDEAVVVMTQHVLSKKLSVYLTRELLDMIYKWHKNKIPTYQLECII